MNVQVKKKKKLTKKMISAFDTVGNTGKRRKCWLLPFCSVYTMFSNGFSLSDVRALDCKS